MFSKSVICKTSSLIFAAQVLCLTASTTHARTTFPSNSTWDWQISGPVSNTNRNVDAFNLDLYENSATTITNLKRNGKKVICYFSAGSYEEWRPDAKSFNNSDLGNTLDGWPGERWLNITSQNVKNIMSKRMDLAVQKGCDAVEPDNMDGYANNNGLGLSYSEQLSYNIYLANAAHSRGLAIGMKNNVDQVSDLVDYYDFAINEECHQYNECDTLKPFYNQNKAIFSAEYASKYKSTQFNSMCSKAASIGMHSVVFALDLDNSYYKGCTLTSTPTPTPTPTIGSIVEGEEYILQRVNTHSCLSVQNGSTKNGANILNQSCNSKDNQKFVFWEEESGKYSMTAQHSDKVVVYNKRKQKCIQRSYKEGSSRQLVSVQMDQSQNTLILCNTFGKCLGGNNIKYMLIN